MIDFNRLKPGTTLFRHGEPSGIYSILSINRETGTAKCKYFIGDSWVIGPVSKNDIEKMHRRRLSLIRNN